MGSESLLHIFDEKKDTYPSAWFYADDGNTKITNDCYGTKLYAVPIGEFTKVLRNECNRQKTTQGEVQRRCSWALSLLSRMKNYHPLDNLSVILFYH